MKILIGVATTGKHRYCLDELQMALEKQTIKADSLFVVPKGESAYATLLRSRKLNAVEDSVVSKSDSEKFMNARKHIRQFALDNGYDFVLFLEGDIMVPSLGLQYLLNAKGDVVSGAYLNFFEVNGKATIAPPLYKDAGDGSAQQVTYEGAAKAQVMEIGAAGFGCVLVSKKVLGAVEIRPMNANTNDSIAFFVDARAKGFKCLAHTGVKCLHLVYPISDPRAKLLGWTKRVEDLTYTANLPNSA